MEPVGRQFVERRDESFYLAGSRVPLASVVREFQEGQSPEAIRSALPTLTLEQVYGAITFYLGHKEEVDREVVDREVKRVYPDSIWLEGYRADPVTGRGHYLWPLNAAGTVKRIQFCTAQIKAATR